MFESIKMMLTELSTWERTLYGIKEIKAPRLRVITAEHSDKLDVILSKLVEWNLRGVRVARRCARNSGKEEMT